MSEIPQAAALGLIGCHACGAACRDGGPAWRCGRCGAALHRRKPDSLARTTALLLAALILYVPANVLPVMTTRLFGQADDSTILGGIVEFWRDGDLDIAIIIFIASVAVPAVKFFVLGMLVVTARRRSNWARHNRARLYRLIETIGYWSMLDVVVVALVSSLVRFGALGNAEPRAGIAFFGVVVVLTMLAAMSFDPRLIWDGERDEAEE